MKYLKQKTKFPIKENQSGFTLIEILLVIAIIAILAGVLVAGFSGVKENSEKKSLMETMNTVTRSAKGCIDFDGDGNLANDINVVNVGGGVSICVSGPSDYYPALPSGMVAKYAYGYSDAFGNEGSFYGYDLSDPPGPLEECTSGEKCFVICDIESGNCYNP